MNRIHVLVACIALVAACGDKKDPKTATDDRPDTTADRTADADRDTTSTPTGTGMSGTSGSTSTTADAGVPSQDPAAAGGAPGTMAKPTDAQIAHVLVTANGGEVEAGNLAKKKSKDPAVLAFAEQMVVDHTAAKDKTQALATKLTLTLEDNDTSKAMKTEHDATMARLAALDGAAFDKAYVDAMVEGHTKVLAMIDTLAAPNAQDAELKALVTEMRPKVSMHLDHAKKLQAQMGTGAIQ